MRVLRFLVFLILISKASPGWAQNATVLSSRLEAYENSFPIEKLYLSFDKPYYSAGDTLWFKSFLLNADYSASTRTDKIYVELFNDSLQYLENRVIMLNNGLGYGDFALAKNLREGTYTIRAYSNWQQNFGADYFFQHSFYIGNAGEKTWLLNSYQKLTVHDRQSALDVSVGITNIRNEPVGLKSVTVTLMNNQQKVLQADLQTTMDGKLTTTIPLTNIALGPSSRLIIADKNDKAQKAVLAIAPQETNAIDLQFMPEGGYMVNGVFGKVAFKAIGADGLGRAISGRIVDDKNETLANLNTIHKGMGSFFLLPKNGETYTAIFNINGTERKQILPKAKEEGTAIRVDHLSIPDTVLLYIKATETKRKSGYFLVAQAQGEQVLQMELNLSNGFSILKIPKKEFPAGVIHFTVFSSDGFPLNERQVLINHGPPIDLNVKPSQNFYVARDSIMLELTAKTENGEPISGSFSIAVTDDNQIKQDDGQNNIISHFMLKSNLKGTLEEPGWYFSKPDKSKLIALDQLLLTQGWIGYRWETIFKGDSIVKFKAEKGNSIEGNITKLLKKPASNLQMTLLSLGKNFFVADTTTDEQGKFTFIDLPIIDTVAYTIKIKNAKGKVSGATIMVDEFMAAKNIDKIDYVKPWYNNADTSMHKFYTTTIAKNKVPAFSPAGTMLKEVEIKGKTKLKNFIETTAWDAKIFTEINEEELKRNARKTLFDLIKAKIPNFGAGTHWYDTCSGRPGQHSFRNYVIGSSLVSHIMIDKINTHMVATGVEDDYNRDLSGISKTAVDPEIFATNEYILNHISAEDVKNITIYKGCAYYFLEVTTRGGKGPWIVPSAGLYVYRPLPIYRGKDFYSPKYSSNQVVGQPDFRSTIFWEANLVTDEQGKAKLTFYAADTPSTYTIKIEGSDLQGRFGFHSSKIRISPSKTN